MRSKSSIRGATLLELLTSATITLLVLAGATAVLFSGSSSWARGIGKIGAETDAQMSVRTTSQKLREAMSVFIDPDGMGLTFRQPKMDAAGNYVLPITWDGIKRRIACSGTQLVLSEGGSSRVIANGVVKFDPMSKNSSPYRIFTANPGLVVRQVTIELAVQRSAERAKVVATRGRETIYLRNIPELSN